MVRIHNVEGQVQEPGEDVHVRHTPMGAVLGVDACSETACWAAELDGRGEEAAEAEEPETMAVGGEVPGNEEILGLMVETCLAKED